MCKQKNCAWCKNPLGRETGDSSLFRPLGPSITLCKDCFFREDELIESKGTNNIPQQLQFYLRNLIEMGVSV